jgi:tetratricopeptide (TPR) repeat protein
MTAPAVRIFCSYSHKDEEALKALKAHLAEVRRQGRIDDWHDRDIQAGEDWAQAIDDALAAADLVLLLVSPDFLNSDYCNGVELERALKRARTAKTRIIPIYIRPAYWKGASFARFQGLPRDARPVYGKDSDPDEAWVAVVAGIDQAVREVRGETRPPRKPWTPSPGLPRPRPIPWLLAGVAGLLLAGLAIWWLFGRPDSALTTRLTEAREYLDTGRYGQALQAFEAALAIDPDSPKAVLGRSKATIFADIGPDFDAEAAETRLRALDKTHPNDPHIQVMLARLAAARGDRDRAQSLYQRALELDSDVAQAWFALGVLYLEKGNLADARIHYKKALGLAANQRQYLTNLAAVQVALGDYKAAQEAYERVLVGSPRLLLARLDAGNVARLDGDLDLAAWHHARLMNDLSQPEILLAGDNAIQWAFDLPGGVVTMDAPETKRAYALLTISVTRYLKGDEKGADETWSMVSEFPERARSEGVLDNDLKLLAKARPEWKNQIPAFRKRFSLSTR